MKRAILLLLLIFQAPVLLHAQRYFTRNGEISFLTKSPAETVHAVNRQVLAIIDPGKNEIAISLLVKGFLFEKQLMQDHFNESVLESDRYPKAVFTGSFADPVDLSKPQKTSVRITGKLTLHGVTQPVATTANLEVQPGKIAASCHFKVAYADYKVQLPAILKNTVARDIGVTVKILCTPM